MIWFIYFAAAFGLAFIVGHSQISLPIRVLVHRMGALGRFVVELLECPACFGFWTGFFWVVVPGSSMLPVLLPTGRLGWALVLGCATSGVNFFLANYSGLSHGSIAAATVAADDVPLADKG